MDWNRKPIDVVGKRLAHKATVGHYLKLRHKEWYPGHMANYEKGPRAHNERISFKILDTVTGEIYQSAREVSRKFNMYPYTVCNLVSADKHPRLKLLRK